MSCKKKGGKQSRKRSRDTIEPTFDVPDISLEEPQISEPFEAARHNKKIAISEPFISPSTVSTNAQEDELSSGSCAIEKSEFDEYVAIADPFHDTDILGDFVLNEDTSEKLFESSQLTVNKALAILFTWFRSCPGITKAAFGRLLYLLHQFLLPCKNNLPSSYASARRDIDHLIVPVQEFDACINDCTLFMNDECNRCSQCGEDRFEPYSKIPRKKFKYIPLGPRLKKMFANQHISKLLQDHLKIEPNESNILSDLHQSESWQARYSEGGPFHGDPRGVCLSLCTDGTNPFAKQKKSYSMWPIMLTILNLPFPTRVQAKSILLAGIIPGPSEPHNLDPYIGVLVNEVNALNGIQFYDAYRDEKFTVQVDILMHIVDYPGHNKLFHCLGAGAYAGCAYCTHVGEYSKVLRKMIYPGSRSFLNEHDILRADAVNFPSKKKDASKPPALKDNKYVDDANASYHAASTNQDRTVLSQTTGCKGAYALRELPLHERILNTPVDPMHLVKNIIAHCVHLIGGIEDSLKVREEEKLRGRFKGSWIKENFKGQLPPAPFALSKEDIVKANERAKQVLVPSNFDWHSRDIFGSTVSMKSHEWKELATEGILKFSLRGLLGSKQRKTLFKLFDVLRKVCSEEVDLDRLDDIERDVHQVLALLERDFPVSMKVIVFHLFHHLPMYLKRYGPVYMFWMFPYERFNSWIIRRVQNRRYPEATVLETYRITEWASFMELSEQISERSLSTDSSCYEDDDESDEFTDIAVDESAEEVQLSEHMFMLMTEHYTKEIAEFGKFIEQYETERKHARVYHRLKNFPDISEWTPRNCQISPEQLQKFRSGPCHSAVKLKQYKYRDSYRSMVLSCAEHESNNSSYRNSYVAAKDSPLRIGRIVLLLKHTFLSISSVFAYVSFFDGPYLDAESNLFYILANGQTQSLLPIKTISKPLAIAIDDNESDKIWILNL